jgi:adenosylmethionine-8-amino-7-oxononanoate aminotransferase
MFFQQMMGIVKIGGNIVDNPEALETFLADFHRLEGRKLLVHGGGVMASKMARQLGIETKMVDGRRITDAETLKLVTMVYAGWINKSIVASLQKLGCQALGLSGADANTIPAKRRSPEPIDFGFVGDPTIQSPFNTGHEVAFVPLNDIDAVVKEVDKGDVAAIVIEGIQGVAGIFAPDTDFLQQLELVCQKHDVVLILDEVQSGYGRTGKFFAHQFADIKADIITTAKGMGNGFPIGGVIISPKFKPRKGMLGTTFGGNHLACAAAIAVLNVIKTESLINNAEEMGNYLQKELSTCRGIEEIRGRGLMIGVQLSPDQSELRNKLLFESHIFTGGAKNNVMRLLPPLSISKNEIDIFIREFKKHTEQ